MVSPAYTMAIDQGTTSSRVCIYDANFNLVARGQHTFQQHYPQDGWVEHDPEAIWSSVLKCYQLALADAKIHPSDIASIGITNQRETVVVWDRATGYPIYPAIVWQDRRTESFCDTYRDKFPEVCQQITEKTGLCLDPYFSATKIRWILDNVKNAQQRAVDGELAFGTIDCFLLWRLTHGEFHATDVTNASRTLLYNTSLHQWDADLLSLFDIPPSILPDVHGSGYAYGISSSEVLGSEIPISCLVGDQHASLIGHGCFEENTAKMTFGTGGFLMLNTGTDKVTSSHGLLSTIAFEIDGKTQFALEGSLFMAGASVQWLKDGIGILDDLAQSESLAASVPVDHGVYLVPAFTGLGAPHWCADARGTLMGLTRDTQREHIVSATLQSVAYQTYDLIQCMKADGKHLRELRVDGGMAANAFAMQCLSDILQIPVAVASTTESTVKGAALISAFHAGTITDMKPFTKGVSQTYQPKMNKDVRQTLIDGWQRAVSATLFHSTTP